MVRACALICRKRKSEGTSVYLNLPHRPTQLAEAVLPDLCTCISKRVCDLQLFLVMRSRHQFRLRVNSESSPSLPVGHSHTDLERRLVTNSLGSIPTMPTYCSKPTVASRRCLDYLSLSNPVSAL